MNGWQVELMNLPASIRQQLQDRVNTTHSSDLMLIKALHTCGDIMRNNDLDETAEQNTFREKALVRQNTKTGSGLPAFILNSFCIQIRNISLASTNPGNLPPPLQELPVKGHLILYTPAQKTPPLSQTDVAGIIKQSSENPLNSPFQSLKSKNAYLTTLHRSLKLIWHQKRIK